MNQPMILFLLSLFFAIQLHSEVTVTRRQNNCLREGPGSYYPLLATLPENTALEVIERSDQWVKVKLPQQKTGWVAINCLADKKKPDRKTMDLAKVWSSPKASRTGITAAIKGFAQKYGKTDPGNVDLVLRYADKTFTSKDLDAFNEQILQTPSANRGKLNMGDIALHIDEYDPAFTEQQVGVGIASRITARGLVTGQRLRNYVNLIATTLTQHSNVYDWDFTVYIIRDKKINGFAVPGGYVFITLGALQQCADESELAAIIAHEIGHVIARHGLREMTKRLPNIKSDQAFAELDEETGESSEETKELEAYMEQAYEKILSKRQLEYELEADKISAVLCANAGYDPFGLVRINEKVMRAAEHTTDIFDPNYMAPDVAKLKHDATKKFTTENFEPDNPGARMKDRFLTFSLSR